MTENLKCCAICATCGRHTALERSVRFFLNQTYDNKVLLIYQNSEVTQRLGDFEGRDKIILINNHIDSQTGEPYKTLGGIYNDAIQYLPEDTSIITFYDDDDTFLPNHVQEGVKGFIRGNRKAYKPRLSYFRLGQDVQLVNNTMEPSMFIAKEVIQQQGFSLETSAQHLRWVNWLIENDQIYVDPEGPSTLVYNWGDPNIPIFKTSGDPGNPENFNNYRNFSQDHGDRIITPWDNEYVQKYYK